ncbi:potassium transporter TrkG [Flammeovirgaceae bacterium SG7u.111]|nr:potassium transporter TrkG [Flammeovirgaceae bacterium SG7u.132]WPO38077.1 potassium transporter TrkG [Flammeovirgaceae bacterium SG7u.111]
MENPGDFFKNYIYNYRPKAMIVLRIISALNITASLLLLFYRYGFLSTELEKAAIIKDYNYPFFIYLGVYLARLAFSLKTKAFFNKNRLETGLMGFILVNGLLNYLIGFQPIPFLLESLLGIQSSTLLFGHFLSFYLITLIVLELTKVSAKISDLKLKAAATFIYSFILLVLTGTGMLTLPAMTKQSGSMPFLDALFTSVSASCVTGLTVVDTGTFFTLKGQLVILLLFQMGGIGIVSFATFFATFIIKGVGIRQQSMMQDMLSSESLVSATTLLKRVVIITLAIEFLGAVAIYFSWDQTITFDDFGQKVFFSIFHSISAFCNAGFSLFNEGLFTNTISDGSLLKTGVDIDIRHMYQLHFIIALMIVLGSLGFTTFEDVFTFERGFKIFKNPEREWRTSTRIAIYSTGFLLVLGTMGFMVLEFHQLTDRTIIEALNTSFFQSVTTRTAGFNTMNFGGMSDGIPLANPTIIMCIFLMFIGASPGSTGGGIKSSTFFLMTLSAVSSIQGKDRIEFAKRTIPEGIIRKAFSIFVFATTYNLLAVFILSITESGSPDSPTILSLVFEQISAFSTVGLSMGLTGNLSSAGKIVIICSMFIGRIGTLTLALALSKKVTTNAYQYPETHIMVG